MLCFGMETIKRTSTFSCQVDEHCHYFNNKNAVSNPVTVSLNPVSVTRHPFMVVHRPVESARIWTVSGRKVLVLLLHR